MNSTSKTRIKCSDDPNQFNRICWIGYLASDYGLLHRTRLVTNVSGSCVPGSGNYSVVNLGSLALDSVPVTQRAAGSFAKASSVGAKTVNGP